MGKNIGCLKFLKDDNPSLLIVHCVIKRENLVAKNVAPKLHQVLYSAIKCINFIKANSETECLFQKFCEVNHSDHVRLLLLTEVRWLSKGNCLKRFMELFEPLSVILKDKFEMILLAACRASHLIELPCQTPFSLFYIFFVSLPSAA